MDIAIYIIVGVLFAFIGLVGVAATFLSLSGAWLIVGLAIFINLIEMLYRPDGADPTFAWWLIIVATILAGLAEIIEYSAGVVGAKAGGSTKRGMWGALIGALIGGIAGIFIVILPLVSSLVGAVIGAFVGAVIGEITSEPGRTWRSTIRPASGASIGRILGTAAKIPITFVVWLVLTVDVFWR